MRFFAQLLSNAAVQKSLKNTINTFTFCTNSVIALFLPYRKLNAAHQYHHYLNSVHQLNRQKISSHHFGNTKAFITNAETNRQLGFNDGWLSGPITTKPIRVMMLGLRGFPDVQGGIETHAEHLAPMLVSLGCDLEVVVRSAYQKPNIGKQWCGVKLTKLWSPKSKIFEAIVHTFLGVLYAAIKRPDILHIHAIGPALMTPLARLLGLRVVVTHHGPDYNRQKWGVLARHMLLLGEWVGMRFSHCIIVISNVIHDMVAHKHTVDSTLIHNGVVLPDLNVSSAHLAQFGLQQHQYILLVSRLVPEKRHLDLIEAFNKAHLVGYKLAFVGSSDHPDDYVKMLLQTAASNPNIVFTGFQKGDVLRSLYAHAALFVLPSSHEGLSISLLEALSYGLPVIASDIPANLEIGLSASSYFKLGNVSELAQLLTQNMQQNLSAEQRIDQKTHLRTWVHTQYNWKNIAEKTVKTYRSLLY